MVERTLAIIKPDAVKKRVIGDVIQRYEAAGLNPIAMEMMHLSESIAEGFYAVHRERPFFHDLTTFMSSGPSVVLVLEGGARYFQGLEKRLSRRIRKADRIWIALAAYNVGMGHIKDAQHLARRMGKNPHSWNDLKTALPLLAQKPYYKTLRYGYARGWEPVRYVKRIRAYHALLEQHLREI